MAEFSKQYCERNSSLELQPDFDINEISEGLENGFYTDIICEGFGFTAIGKNDDGETIVFFPNSEKWETLNDLIL